MAYIARENLTPIVSSLKEIKHYHNSNSPENCSSWDSCVVLILRHFHLFEILKHDCFQAQVLQCCSQSSPVFSPGAASDKQQKRRRCRCFDHFCTEFIGQTGHDPVDFRLIIYWYLTMDQYLIYVYLVNLFKLLYEVALIWLS